GINRFHLDKRIGLLVTVSKDYSIKLWNPVVTKGPNEVLEGHVSRVVDVAILKHIHSIISISEDAVSYIRFKRNVYVLMCHAAPQTTIYHNYSLKPGLRNWVMSYGSLGSALLGSKTSKLPSTSNNLFDVQKAATHSISTICRSETAILSSVDLSEIEHLDDSNETPRSPSLEILEITAIAQSLMKIQHSCHECTLSCESDELDCYVIDGNGYVVISEEKNDTGRFFGDVEGAVMDAMINKNIFRAVFIQDYQGICSWEEPVASDATRHILTVGTMTINDQVNCWTAWDSHHVRICVPFYVKRLPHTNLLLIVVNTLHQSCFREVSNRMEKIEYDNPHDNNSTPSCNKLNLNYLPRRPLTGCFNYHPMHRSRST
ncbi:unnamed protein product, partial [Nesidiocoris tenuis]